MTFGVAAALAVALAMLGFRISASQTQLTPVVLAGEPVVMMTLQVQDEVRIERTFPGRIEAPRQTAIGFEIGGRIERLAVQEGTKVARGDELARLDSRGIVLEREAVAAKVAGLQDQSALSVREVERLERLVSKGAAPANALDRARTSALATAAALSEAEAELAAADLRLQQTVLLAPETGVVGAVLVQPEETVAAGQALMSIFQEGPGQLRVALPPDLDPVSLLKPQLDLGGQQVEVSLMSARPDVDPATNSREAVFALSEAAGASIMPGQTGRLVATIVTPMRGAWVPTDALRPNPEGTWMLVGVSADLVAERIDVEVLHITGQEAFVAGAFADGERIVAGGVHKVVPGQLLSDAEAQGP